jgi:antitoxin PrlF
MSVSTLTSKGQMTLPKEIREKLGLKAKDQLHLTLLADGTIIMRAKKRSVSELYGVLYKPGRRPVPVSKMNPWR